MIDNSEFLSVVHSLVSNSNDCIVELKKRAETQDASNKELLLLAATLLKIHNNLITNMVEQNAGILDQANALIEKLDGTK